MYNTFYNLNKAPFANIPDPGLLFLSPQHQRALSVLKYALMARAGFCVITGDIGTGKTTLVRRLLQDLDVPLEVGLVSNTQCESFEEFLQWILLAFDLEYRGKEKVELYDTFTGYLIDQFQKGHPVTLIIDEAQHLGPEYLEQLRMLSNINTEKGQILQTILIGQPELWDLLRKPELDQFAQRISYDYFIAPLNSVELIQSYIQYRIEASGGDKNLFVDDTFQLIWESTGGIPRLINLVCDTALVYGYAEGKKNIDRQIIDQVLEEKESSFTPIGKRFEESQDENSLQQPSHGKSHRNRPIKNNPSRGKTELTTIERAALRMNKPNKSAET
ncbi:MAG: AAA family ATPase [Pseudomonadales bacterium]|nr:AAA family ATPase [Pseudomonadales bacterium]